MTRVNNRIKPKIGNVNEVNGQDNEDNAKDSQENSTKDAVPPKVKEIKVKGLKDTVDLINLHGLGNSEERNLDLADFEDLFDGVKVEGHEDELHSEDEEDEDEDEDEDDVDEEDDENEIDEETVINEDDVKAVAAVGEDGKFLFNGGIRFKCEFCDYSFARKSMLIRHIRIHTGERPYECEKCDAKFTQQGGLKTHMLCKHRDVLDQKDQVLYQCHHCDRSFLIKERLRIHLRLHTGELPYVCHICSKKFRRNGGLLQHLRRHIGMRPYTCEICKASYYNSTNLKTHMKRHLGVQDYICELCGKGFTRRDGLRKHLACLHYDHCAFRCSICNKSFKGHILSHLRMHLKEKPFKCEECGMRFVQSSQLVVHKRTHTGAKPYQCQICKVAFSHSSALRMHIRRHTGEKPVKCLLCPAAFVQLPHLKKHMRCIHKSEKPYVCVPCYVFFRTKVELDEHIAINGCSQPVPPTAPVVPVPTAPALPADGYFIKMSPHPEDDKDLIAVLDEVEEKVSEEEMLLLQASALTTPEPAPAADPNAALAKRATKRKAEKNGNGDSAGTSAKSPKSVKNPAACKEQKSSKKSAATSETKRKATPKASSRNSQVATRSSRKSSTSTEEVVKIEEPETRTKKKAKAVTNAQTVKNDKTPTPPRAIEKSESSSNSRTTKSSRGLVNLETNAPKTRSRGKVVQTPVKPTTKIEAVTPPKLSNGIEDTEDSKKPATSPSRRSSLDITTQDTSKVAETQTHDQDVTSKRPILHTEDSATPEMTRERSESPAGVSLVTLPICEPLKPVDQPHSAMVNEMMLAVTNRLKLGSGTPRVVVRTQPMPIEKIRMLLAILLTRISTPDRLKSLGFGKILIDDVLCASIVSSGREPCDKTGLSEREVILKNVRILLDWTVPKVYMDRFKRENRSTEDLLEELTS